MPPETQRLKASPKQESDQNKDRQKPSKNRPLLQVITRTVTLLQLLAPQPNLVDPREQTVNATGTIPGIIRRTRRRHHRTTEPAVERRRPAILHRPLNVTEQNDAVLVSGVFSVMNKRFVEHH